jgi:hypothetical protein
MIELILQHWYWFFTICFTFYTYLKTEKIKQPILEAIAFIIVGVFWPFSIVILTLNKIFGYHHANTLLRLCQRSWRRSESLAKQMA